MNAPKKQELQKKTDNRHPLPQSVAKRKTTPVAIPGLSNRKPLMEKESLWQQLIWWGGMVLLFIGVTLGAYLIFSFFAYDWDNQGIQFFPTVLATDPKSVSDAIGGYVELLAAILGIMITVVAIVLQLAAQRYGTRLIDLFLSHTVNRLYFILLVCSLLYSILIVFAIKEVYFPHYAVQTLLVLTLLEIALLAPYFLFVFKLITPTNLLMATQEKSKTSASMATHKRNYANLKKYQAEVALSLEQVTDTALNAITQMDRNLALMAIDQIREMILDYLLIKKRLPRMWFLVSQEYFIGTTSEFHREICDTKLWVEAKGFIDMRLIFEQSMEQMPDGVNAIAVNTRTIGQAAIKLQDDELLDFAIRFFNSFIRDAINAVKVRAIFNILYQYRLLTESVFDYNPQKTEEIFGYFLEYGNICLGKGDPLDFALTTVAFDLKDMVVFAYDKKLKNLDNLLNSFMTVEDRVDPQAHFVIYMMVRLAQLQLATFLFSKNDHKMLSIVAKDLENETIQQLTTWRNILLGYSSRRYQEITARGYQFLYIDDNQKRFLNAFFEEYIFSRPDRFKQA